MITENEALQLLKKYMKNERIIKHCLGAADVAYEIASKIHTKNPDLGINPNKVKIAALLHDIGRCRDGVHEFNTIDILKREGLSDIAEIAMHGFLYEILEQRGEGTGNLLPRKLENKVVALADMYYNQDEQRVSLNQRMDDIAVRHRGEKEFLKAMELARKRFEELESEINSLM